MTLCASITAEETGAGFLQSVMSRINGKDPDAAPGNDLARPVADLK